MITIRVCEFKVKCLALIDQFEQTGETIVVTKRGKPVAELRAHRQSSAKTIIGLYKGRIAIHSDIVAPITASLWKALK